MGGGGGAAKIDSICICYRITCYRIEAIVAGPLHSYRLQLFHNRFSDKPHPVITKPRKHDHPQTTPINLWILLLSCTLL